MTKIRKISFFGAFLLLLLLISFAVQSLINTQLQLPIFENLIVAAYASNYFLVLLTFSFILFLKDKHNASIGFIFMFGFLLKMAVFFIFFKPVYQLNNEIEGQEFAAFFVPYAICLTFETYYLVKLLSKS